MVTSTKQDQIEISVVTLMKIHVFWDMIYWLLLF